MQNLWTYHYHKRQIFISLWYLRVHVIPQLEHWAPHMCTLGRPKPCLWTYRLATASWSEVYSWLAGRLVGAGQEVHTTIQPGGIPMHPQWDHFKTTIITCSTMCWCHMHSDLDGSKWIFTLTPSLSSPFSPLPLSPFAVDSSMNESSTRFTELHNHTTVFGMQ